MRFGLLAAMTTADEPRGPRFGAGLCVVQKQDNGRDVQLKARLHCLRGVGSPLTGNAVTPWFVALVVATGVTLSQSRFAAMTGLSFQL